MGGREEIKMKKDKGIIATILQEAELELGLKVHDFDSGNVKRGSVTQSSSKHIVPGTISSSKFKFDSCSFRG